LNFECGTREKFFPPVGGRLCGLTAQPGARPGARANMVWVKDGGAALICDCCKRKVDSVRSGPVAELWFGDDRICRECFIEWYDGNRPTADCDQSNKLNIGNWVRKKHGLQALP
jgi:hypothetical protein